MHTILSTDFCPWANRYVYWLKQPVGWFVVAMFASILVGSFLNPIGWTLAIGLGVILVLGLGLPWLVVNTVRCELVPAIDSMFERQNGDMLLTVRNRLPIPVWGLIVNGYLTHAASAADAGDLVSPPEIGLGSVPPLSRATFRMAIAPEYRGQYPIGRPEVCCAFPFGIWTARKSIDRCDRVTVRPMLLPLQGVFEVSGQQMADSGDGNRLGTTGDFLGVRDFRRGDSLRSIHWAQTARTGNFVVCERGGPQMQTVAIELSTAPCEGGRLAVQENLAWRVRIVASLIDLLGSRHIPFRLTVDGELWSLPAGGEGIAAAWDRLASIPLAGKVSEVTSHSMVLSGASRIAVSATSTTGQALSSRFIRVSLAHKATSLRDRRGNCEALVDLDADIASALDQFLEEATYANGAA